MTQALVLTRWLPRQQLEANWAAEERNVRAAVDAIAGARIVELNPGTALVEVEPVAGGASAAQSLARALPDWEISQETHYKLPAL